VDVEHFHPGKRDPHWRRGFGIEDDAVLVVHVGRLAPEKDIATLTAAWAIAHESLGRRAVFLVAGDGPEAGAIDRGLPWARRLGFLDRNALATLYASADLCVLTSPTETCGLVALEAMASGVAVVAADAGGFRESVHHERDGILVPASDPLGFAARIVELSMNATRRRRLAEAARITAAARDATRENHSLMQQYAELIDHPVPEDTPCAA
jgi:glycosyltransferase involved in cell wall biosynthesis